MMKHARIRWFAVLLSGLLPFTGFHVLADQKAGVSKVKDILRCKTSLKQFSLHLEGQSKQRTNQPYYGNLYQQTHDFLKTLDDFSLNSSQLNKCENFLKVIQKIVGARAVPADLGSMPNDPGLSGKLTNPLLETTKRPMRRSIRYVVVEEDNQPQKKIEEEDEARLASSSLAPGKRRAADWEEEKLE